MKQYVLLLLVFLLLASVSNAYTIEGNSVFIEDSQASLRVTPATAQYPSAEGYKQEFEICNKTGTTVDLYGAYVFNYELQNAKAEYAIGEDENGFIWLNVTSSFEKKEIGNKFAYAYTSGKTVLANSCETWKITYKPNEIDSTEKWDLWLWAGDDWSCILNGTCLKELRLDPWWDSIGSESDPYIMTDCNSLHWALDNNINNANVYFELGNDIDCSAYGNWVAIGDAFKGNLDGNNYSISNVTITTTTVNKGAMFDNLNGGANIENLALIDFNVWNSANCATTLACRASGSAAYINNVYVSGATIASGGTFYAGGLIGAVSDGTLVHDCYVVDSTIRADGAARVGGFVGYADAADTNFANNYSSAFVNGDSDEGGFIGAGVGAIAENNFWDLTTSGQAASVYATGKTTANMFKQATFTNWNFETIWVIVEDVNYPTLIQFGLPGPPAANVDLNITTINGLDYKTHPIFAYGLDGNITINFNVFQSDNNRLSVDLNYSQTSNQGTGTVIIKDLNLSSSICTDQDWSDIPSACSYSWDYSAVVDGNYGVNGLITDSIANTDFNNSDGNFEIADDVNLLIYVPIDESTGDTIDTSTYSFIVKILNAGIVRTYSNQIDENHFTIPISTDITILIDTNVDAYYWGREYQLLYETAMTSDTLQPYLAPLGSSVLTTIHTVSMATLTAIPNMTIKVYKDLIGGRTLINNSLTDGKGETAVAFVIADNYEIEVWDESVLLYTENYVATTTTNNHYIYLPLGGGVEFPVIPNISVRYLPAIRERTSTDFNVQVIIASNNGSISSARVNLFNNGINLFDTGIDTLILGDGNTYIINVNDLIGLDTAYPLDANVTVWLIDGTTITSREDSWRFYFLGAEEDSMIWLLTTGMRKDFGCSYGTDALLGTTCQPLFLISIFIIFFAIGGLALNQFRNGTALAILAIIMTSFFVYITWIPFVWGVLMAVGGIVIIITTSRVDM